MNVSNIIDNETPHYHWHCHHVPNIKNSRKIQIVEIIQTVEVTKIEDQTRMHI